MRHNIFNTRRHAVWSEEEDTVLMASLTRLGLSGVCDLLIGRTLGAIKTRVNTLKTRGKWVEPDPNAPPVPAYTSLHPRDRVDLPLAVAAQPLPSNEAPPNAWVPKAATPGVDLEQREFIRKRVVWEIQHLAGELSLSAVKVARCMQELARDDFRGPRLLPSVLTEDDIPNMHQSNPIGRTTIFASTRPMGFP